MRTVNRAVNSVPQYSEDALGYKYFNIYDWKGLYDSKNFMNVEQSSFEYCCNVYISSDDILRSRPAIVNKTAPAGLNNLSIVNIEQFSNVTVYTVSTTVEDTYTLYFVKEGVSETKTLSAVGKYKLVLADNKIYLFSGDKIRYYNIQDNTTSEDASSDIYIPVVSGDKDNAEYPNVLTSATYNEILYNKASEPDVLRPAYSKSVKVKIDGNTYTIDNFKQGQEDAFLSKLTTLTDKEYRTRKGPVSVNVPNVQVSDNNTVMIYEYFRGQSDNTYKIRYKLPNDTNWRYSDNAPGNVISNPVLSLDGSTIYQCINNTTATSGYIIYKKYLLDDNPTWVEYAKNTFNKEDYYIVLYPINSATIYVYLMYEEEGYTLAFIQKYINITSVTTDEPVTSANIGSIQINNYPFNGGEKIFQTNVFVEYAVEPIFKYDTIKNCLYILTYVYKIQYTDGQGSTTQITEPYLALFECEGDDLKTYMSDSVTYTYTSSSTTEVNVANILHNNLYYLDYCIYEDNGNDKFTIYNLGNSTDSKFVISGLLARQSVTTAQGINILKSSPVFTTIDNTSPLYANNIKVTNNKKYITNRTYYDNESFSYIPAGNNDTTSYNTLFLGTYAYVELANTLYTTEPINTIVVDYYTTGETKIFVPDLVLKLNDYFFVDGKTIYRSKQGGSLDVGEFEWYFPTNYTQTFEEPILNIHPISVQDFAIFFENSIYYATYDDSTGQYLYYKSKIPLGIKKGSEIVTSYDGKYTIFSSQRGLVAMSYQDFISSTEQALTYLSDNIFDYYDKWNVDAIRLTTYKFWLLCYRPTSNIAYLYDMRNSSWWPISIKKLATFAKEINYEFIIIIDNHLYTINTSDNNYVDFDGVIDWQIVSQKLHFNATNYVKNIQSITFNAVNDENRSFTFGVQHNLYRSKIDFTKPEILEYKVNVINTFVKRTNYFKVREFQFKLYNDIYNANQLPLSLTNISIKYKITGQVR